MPPPAAAPPAAASPLPPFFLVLSKYPHAGHANTRLIPALGADGAAAVSRTLSGLCVAAVRALCAAAGATVMTLRRLA